MTDRETVMSWLEGLAQDDWRQYHSDSEVQEIARGALALLEEREPVEKDGWHYCGVCGRLIDSDFADEEAFPYCPNCGRKVKMYGDS